MTRTQGGDPVARISLLIAVLGLAGMVALVPSLVPAPLRSALGLGPHRIAEAPRVDDSGSYRFLAHQSGDPDAPVGYDPCRRVDYRVNLAGAPPGGLDLIRTAIGRAEDATGLRFRYRGTTEARPHWESATVPVLIGEPRTFPALFSWATAAEVPELAGDVAGIGGSVPAPDLGGTRRYVTGGVTLDQDIFTALAATESGRREALAIVMHEVAHLVGLAHVEDPGELMNAENLGRLDFGPGDRAGLARVGSTPCS